MTRSKVSSTKTPTERCHLVDIGYIEHVPDNITNDLLRGIWLAARSVNPPPIRGVLTRKLEPNPPIGPGYEHTSHV